MKKYRLWRLKTYIPGTREHQSYQDTLAWMAQCQETLEKVIPGLPPMPELPRHPEGMLHAIDCVVDVLEKSKSHAAVKADLERREYL